MSSLEDAKGLTPDHAASVSLSIYAVEPLVPPAPPRSASQRWTNSIELMLALLLNIAFLVALFYRVTPVMPPLAKEPPAISVDLVPQPKPKAQPAPKKPEEPKAPEQKQEQQKKEQEKPKTEQQPVDKPRESGGDSKLKQGRAPKVEADKSKLAPEKKAKTPKPDAPKKPAVNLPDWAKALDQGYDLPKQQDSSSTTNRGANSHESMSDREGEGGGDAYLNQVVAQVAGQLRYPQSAGGVEGLVIMAIVVDRNGNLQGMRMLQSSGYNVLDLAAADAIRRSAPYRPLPADYPAPATITLRMPMTPRM